MKVNGEEAPQTLEEEFLSSKFLKTLSNLQRKLKNKDSKIKY